MLWHRPDNLCIQPGIAGGKLYPWVSHHYCQDDRELSQLELSSESLVKCSRHCRGDQLEIFTVRLHVLLISPDCFRDWHV